MVVNTNFYILVQVGDALSDPVGAVRESVSGSREAHHALGTGEPAIDAEQASVPSHT